jgi:hypothetical protein
MARETFMEAQIPTGVESPVYLDARQISRGLSQHLPEAFIGQVTGAGGAGGTLSGVPFDPAVVEIINEAGATPQWAKYVFLGSGTIGLSVVLAAADATANAPTVTRVPGPPVTFDVGVVTADAPDAEVVTVICYGMRDVNGGL